jgi:hypothetical protein
MNRLLWRLFEMVKEVMPATEANAKRFAEWAAEFAERDAPTPPIAEVATANPQHEFDEIMDDEPAEDPHEHGVPSRPRGRRKR